MSDGAYYRVKNLGPGRDGRIILVALPNVRPDHPNLERVSDEEGLAYRAALIAGASYDVQYGKPIKSEATS